ncbi:MAG: hypothetical protein ILP13_04270 [Lachnospiraceae bacterium]|nr:hypothetical protein [Lachnospiraceae bacterium]
MVDGPSYKVSFVAVSVPEVFPPLILGAEGDRNINRANPSEAAVKAARQAVLAMPSFLYVIENNLLDSLTLNLTRLYSVEGDQAIDKEEKKYVQNQ